MNRRSFLKCLSSTLAASVLMPVDKVVAAVEFATSGSLPTGIKRGYVNLMHFGAFADGVRDDGPAFRAALETCIEGDVLYVPAGFYHIEPLPGHDAAVTVPRGVSMTSML